MLEYSLNIGGSEWMIIIFVAVVLVLGTGKLPGAAKKMGKVVSEYNNAKNEIQQQMKEVNEEIPYLEIFKKNVNLENNNDIDFHFPLESVLKNVDIDRMDILDTIIRTIINSTELPFINAMILLKDWESIVILQLSKSSKPGHLFSPIELPDDF